MKCVHWFRIIVNRYFNTIILVLVKVRFQITHKSRCRIYLNTNTVFFQSQGRIASISIDVYSKFGFIFDICNISRYGFISQTLRWRHVKVRIFWEGHKILKDLPLSKVKFYVEDFFKFCGLLRISELYYKKILAAMFIFFSYSLLSLIKPVIHNCCLFLFFQKKYGWKSMER